VPVTVAMQTCIQWRIFYGGMFLTYMLRWVCNKRMVRTADHNTPRRASSRQIVAGRPGECKNNNVEAFSRRNFNSPNSATECTRTRHFHSENWQFFWEGAQPLFQTPNERGTLLPHPPTSAPTTRAPSALDPCPLQNRRYATGLKHRVSAIHESRTSRVVPSASGHY